MNEYAQYWYWLAVLAVDAFVLMDVLERYHVRDGLGILGIIGGFFAALAAEYLLFVKIWPDSALRWTDKDR